MQVSNMVILKSIRRVNMFDKEKLGQLKKSNEEWENTVNTKVVAKQPERKNLRPHQV
jgi:hypothetical protein